MRNDASGIAPAAVPDRHEIGANGGPKFSLDDAVEEMSKLVGPRQDEPEITFHTDAAWYRFATAAEKKILDIFQGRIERTEARLRALRAKRTRIMNRCIKEKRRKEGKN